tara:strand:- start:45 stop:287 length:243 start_codon:yes stop_codon:yes gene_type:complete
LSYSGILTRYEGYKSSNIISSNRTIYKNWTNLEKFEFIMAEKVYNKNKIETSIIGGIFVDFSAQPIHDHSKKNFVIGIQL